MEMNSFGRFTLTHAEIQSAEFQEFLNKRAAKKLADQRLHAIRLELLRLELEWRFTDETYDAGAGVIINGSYATPNYERFRDQARILEREYNELMTTTYNKEDLHPKPCKRCGLWVTKELIHVHNH